MEPEYIAHNFVPVALDTYFRGNSEEKQFCDQIGAGGNHLVVVTAQGRVLGEGHDLRLRKAELDPLLKEYRALSADLRKTDLTLGANAVPPERPVPDPPNNGLILRGYCSYLDRDEHGSLFRATNYYYRENPDRWAAETQSDMLWLTEGEWKSLVPKEFANGQKVDVPQSIQQRFFSTIGIDYMEGSVNSLPCRESRMEVTVVDSATKDVHMRLDGYAHLGREFDPNLRRAPNSRGCEVRVVGQLTYSRERNAFIRFDIVGVGEAWGNKMDYVDREVRLDDYPWTYGIACELVTTRQPYDRIPPYNLLHYNSSGPYFGEEEND